MTMEENHGIDVLLLQLEISLLRTCGTSAAVKQPETFQDVELAIQLVSLLPEGAYLHVLELTNHLLEGEPDRDLADVISNNVEQYTTNSAREVVVLCVAVACLQLYVQINWMGPPLTSLPPALQQFNCDNVDTNQSCRHDVVARLELDGTPVVTQQKQAIYLYIARVLLVDCHHRLSHCQTANLWCLRYIFLHQSLLPERSPTLKSLAIQTLHNIAEDGGVVDTEDFRDIAVDHHLAAGHLCFFYYEPSMAAEHFNKAQLLSGINIQLTGVLGRRTKYQTKDVSQLVAVVTQTDTAQPWSLPIQDDRVLPTDVDLDDDTLLNQTELHGSPEESDNINSVQQAVILGQCYKHRAMSEVGKIIQEQCEAYVQAVLRTPQSWAVQTKAILIRSLWEKLLAEYRRGPRALAQLEEIIHQYKLPEPPVGERLQHFYALNMPPIWEVKVEWAKMLELVSEKAAAEVYTELECWDELIRLQLSIHSHHRKTTENLIRERLAVKETPLLWCYLGDINRDMECYQTAWDLSNHRFSRAQRSMAALYASKQTPEDSEKAMECYEKSLQLNPLQNEVWFSYGNQALSCSKWDEASKAFRRCVDIESDNHQAWNNLASSYIKRNDKVRAFHALKEALKWEYEDWRIWENYLFVCVDVGEFREAMRAYDRLLEKRGKYVDVKVLEALYTAIKTNVKDAFGNDSCLLRNTALKLMGHVTSKVTSNADVWRIYAELLLLETETETKNSQETEPGEAGDCTERKDEKRVLELEKAVMCLQKAHRCRTSQDGWQTAEQSCLHVLNHCIHLTEVTLKCVGHMKQETQARQMLSATRLLLQGVLTKVKKQWMRLTNDGTEALAPTVSAECTTLEGLLDTVRTTHDKQSAVS